MSIHREIEYLSILMIAGGLFYLVPPVEMLVSGIGLFIICKTWRFR